MPARRLWLPTLLLGCATRALGAEPAQPAETGAKAKPAVAAADAEFLEFLGQDDVEDEAWWDFLSNKRSVDKKVAAPGA